MFSACHNFNTIRVHVITFLFQIIGVDYVYFIQKNILDMRDRCLNIEATNETFSTRVNVIEKCRYYVS